MTSLVRRARVLLVDDSDRLLLFSAADPKRWFTPGGGVEAGESLIDAARRELWEETGIEDVELVGPVWRGRPWRTVREGVDCEVVQYYFLARGRGGAIDTSRFEEFERAAITGYRWWSADELAATQDLLRPKELARLFAVLVDGGAPAGLVEVDG